MLDESLSPEPSKMSIVNLSTGRVLVAQYNPEEFTEELGATYAKQIVPGYSNGLRQFVSTEDVKVGFEMFWTANPGPAARQAMASARLFLQSLLYPRRTAGTIAQAGPPRVLFIWPQFMSLSAVVTALKFKYSSFALDGSMTRYVASVTLESVSDVFVSSEDVEQVGTEGYNPPTFTTGA